MEGEGKTRPANSPKYGEGSRKNVRSILLEGKMAKIAWEGLIAIY